MIPSFKENYIFYLFFVMTLVIIYLICKLIYEKYFKNTKFKPDTAFKLVSIIILIGFSRLIQCIYYKHFLKEEISYLPCPLNSNGIKNSLLVCLSIITIVLLLTKKYNN